VGRLPISGRINQARTSLTLRHNLRVTAVQLKTHLSGGAPWRLDRGDEVTVAAEILSGAAGGAARDIEQGFWAHRSLRADAGRIHAHFSLSEELLTATGPERGRLNMAVGQLPSGPFRRDS